MPPQNVTTYNTSSTSVAVRWNPVPLKHQLGIILGYRLLYRLAEPEPNVTHRRRRAVSPDGNENVDDQLVSYEVTGLQKFTNYCIEMLAYTRIGDGPLSDCSYVVSDEDGTFGEDPVARYHHNILLVPPPPLPHP